MNRRTIEVRPAAPDDADGITASLAALGYGTPVSFVRENVAALARSADDAILVAEDPIEGVVGVVTLHVLPLFHQPGNLARVTALAVRAGHQGKGVGRALMEAAERWAWERGAVRIEITSGDHRREAHAFYKKAGYETDERRFIKRRS